VLGPATIKIASAAVGYTPETRTFGPGLHYFSIYGMKNVGTHVYLDTDPATSGARLFANMFFNKRIDPDSTSDVSALIPGAVGNRSRYMYFQKNKTALGYNLVALGRLRIVAATVQYDVSRDAALAETIPSGQHAVDNVNTRANVLPTNINPWWSGDKTKQIVPRSLAIRDGLPIFYDPQS
jgi:hypothetical protein